MSNVELKNNECKDGKWKYYVNDEGKARWRCSLCGKLCHKNPAEKRYCSDCGARMTMES